MHQGQKVPSLLDHCYAGIDIMAAEFEFSGLGAFSHLKLGNRYYVLILVKNPRSYLPNLTTKRGCYTRSFLCGIPIHMNMYMDQGQRFSLSPLPLSRWRRYYTNFSRSAMRRVPSELGAFSHLKKGENRY